MMQVRCLNCGRWYPEAGVPHRCPNCGGLFDETDAWIWSDPDPTQPGIWRYSRTLAWDGPRVTLGEGRTPLVDAVVDRRKVFFKCEYANPTGSFKDRGAAALVSFLAARGVSRAIEDSSGNAGAAIAAYTARAGIQARILVPESASGPKLSQIAAYGAELVRIPGPRSEASIAAEKAAAKGEVYASHAHLPHVLAGYATAAFEIVEQLGGNPGAVLLPAGQGGLLLGLSRGFNVLAAVGANQRVPRMIGVQAAACAPLAAYSGAGVQGLGFVTEAPTIAEGVRIRSPLRMEAVVRSVADSGGQFVTVQDRDILLGRDSLARLGFYVEPTSALVWPALKTILQELPDPVVVVLTGSGYKWRAN